MILVLSSFWPTASNSITGIFVVQQIAALARLGCDVRVILAKPVGKNVRYLTPGELGLPQSVTLREVITLRIPEIFSANTMAFRLNARFAAAAASAAIAEIIRTDGIPRGFILHGIRYFTLSIPYWLNKFNVNKIVFIHGIDPYFQKLNSKSVKNAFSRVYDHVDVIALVGSSLRKYATDLGINPDRLIVVPNGTDLPEARSASAQPNRPCSIISVSNLVALKGLEDNLQALSILSKSYGLNNWKYTIIGDGPEKTRLLMLAEHLNIDDKVQFLGRIAYDDTMELIADSDIFCLPSWGDAFGIVYLEAMARMKPTIGCRGSGAQDIITHEEDGILVPPKNPEILAKVLRKLIEQPDLRSELGVQARQTAEKFTWDVNARRVLDLLQVQFSDD